MMVSAYAPEFSDISATYSAPGNAALLPADRGSSSIQAACVSTVTPCGSDNNPGLFNGLSRFLAFFLGVNYSLSKYILSPII